MNIGHIYNDKVMIMNKALILTLGAALAAGSAGPALAASQVDFTGYYRVMFMSEGNTDHTQGLRSSSDTYFQHRLNLDVTFRPTDELAVHWRLRGPGSYQRWGGGDMSLYTDYIYGEIKQGWGTILVGRMGDDLDVYGLAGLGYQPENIPIYTNVGPFDRADNMDGVRYSRAWDNGVSLMLQYGLLDNNNITGGTVNYDPITDSADQYYNRYQIEVAYAWDGGGAALNAYYDRNAQPNGRHGTYGWGYQGNYNGLIYLNDFSIFQRPKNPVSGNIIDNGRLHMVKKIETWGFNPAVMHSWGDFSFHFEGLITRGFTVFRTQQHGVYSFYDQDGEGYGAYLDFDYNYGPGNATLAGWWVSGTDLNENPDDLRATNKSLADLVGGNFYPLLVAYNGLNLNPGGSRHNGNQGRALSAVGFANNGYENYVYEGHMGGAFFNDTIQPGNGDYHDSISYISLNGIELNTNSVSRVTGGDIVAAVKGAFLDQVLTSDRTRTTSFNNDTDANHWAIALTGNHAFTDDISMHYGLAYLGLNKPNYRVAKSATYLANVPSGIYDDTWAVTGYTSQAQDLGFEVDLGFSFQLLDNLSFTTAFGYMFNGDAYKSLKGYTVVNRNPTSAADATVQDGDRIKAVWADPDDSYVWFNSLTFAF